MVKKGGIRAVALMPPFFTIPFWEGILIILQRLEL